jgi:hypothetical protein
MLIAGAMKESEITHIDYKNDPDGALTKKDIASKILPPYTNIFTSLKDQNVGSGVGETALSFRQRF